MKLSLVILAVSVVSLGLAAPSQSTFGLKEDIDDFIGLLPIDEIVAIGMDYLANDAEVQEAVEFAQSDDFKNLLYDIEAIPEYREFLKYLQGNGLNVYYYLSSLHDLLGMKPFDPPTRSSSRRGTGVRGLVDDIEAILPYDKIKEMYYDKLETSPAFSNLINVMKGDDFKNVVEQLRANPGFQEVVERLKSQGIDIQIIIDLLNKIFGWGIEA